MKYALFLCDMAKIKIPINYLPGFYYPFVDMIGSKDLGGKMILFIMDGLYGIRDVNDNVAQEFAAWNNLSEGQWLSSLFMSQDPIAIDAVGYDFLRSEFGTRLVKGVARLLTPTCTRRRWPTISHRTRCTNRTEYG